jgi:hypothetical protein
MLVPYGSFEWMRGGGADILLRTRRGKPDVSDFWPTSVQAGTHLFRCLTTRRQLIENPDGPHRFDPAPREVAPKRRLHALKAWALSWWSGWQQIVWLGLLEHNAAHKSICDSIDRRRILFSSDARQLLITSLRYRKNLSWFSWWGWFGPCTPSILAIGFRSICVPTCHFLSWAAHKLLAAALAPPQPGRTTRRRPRPRPPNSPAITRRVRGRRRSRSSLRLINPRVGPRCRCRCGRLAG